MKKIPLSKEKYAVVDDDDFNYLSQYKWSFDRYAYRTVKKDGKRTTVRMHRLIMNAPDGLDVDHINHDKLDNRRSNLRVCSRSYNIRNKTKNHNLTSKYKGVSYDKGRKKWCAFICVNYKKSNLGRFNSEIEAHKAYQTACNTIERKYQ